MRVVTSNGTTWFVAKDVATALGHARPRNAVSRHVRESHKMTYAAMDDQTGHCYHPHTVFNDATRVYSLILGSHMSARNAWRDLDLTDAEGVRLALTNLELESRGQKRKADEQDDLYITRYKDIRKDVVNIGRSVDPEKRRATLEACHDFQVEILAVFPLVHEHLSARRSQRGAGTEWFKVSAQQATETIANAIALYDRGL